MARAARRRGGRPDAAVRAVLAWLERRGSPRVRDELLPRYGITARKAYGVKVGALHTLARRLGRDHALALALWPTGWYEARMLTAFIDEPERVTPAQMDRWAKDFDNWAIADTLCFHLLDRTPHAWGRVRAWTKRREEFVRRAGFALLASLALHDKRAPDAPFRRALALVERGAGDERNFVKKAVSWALRSIGKRKSPALRAKALVVARRLARSTDSTSRWIGNDAIRDLAR